jgi:hypothetical protein
MVFDHPLEDGDSVAKDRNGLECGDRSHRFHCFGVA